MLRSARRFARGVVCRLALRVPRVVSLLPTPAPVLTRCHRCPVSEPPSDLLVLLPGIEDIVDDYERYGFIDEVRRRGFALDLVLVDAHYGYYAKQSVLDRVREDVVVPARASGYRQIWLGGISMGGFGALLYASRFPGDIDGVVALAPYLGSASLIQEIASAGGVRRWHPTGVSRHEHERSLWSWLRDEAIESQRPLLYLGYGEEDRFAPAHRLLSDILPPDRVITTRGKHDWPAWCRLWDSWLTTDAIQRSFPRQDHHTRSSR